jgi:hypothetical protein
MLQDLTKWLKQSVKLYGSTTMFEFLSDSLGKSKYDTFESFLYWSASSSEIIFPRPLPAPPDGECI